MCIAVIGGMDRLERHYREEGVYDRFRYQGFFLVRRGGRLFALSSI